VSWADKESHLDVLYSEATSLEPLGRLERDIKGFGLLSHLHGPLIGWTGRDKGSVPNWGWGQPRAFLGLQPGHREPCLALCFRDLP
jgi:hypothetical protein